MTPDRELKLVTRSAEGDDKAFDDLVRFLAPSLVRFLYSLLSDREAAEEVAQTAFLRAHAKLDRLRQPARFKAWLWRIARYAAFDRVRHQRRRGPSPDSLDAAGADSAALTRISPEHQLLRCDLIDRTRRAVDRLPSDTIEVLMLRYEEELTYQQMADRLGLTLFQVKARLARARAQLRPRLKPLADEWKRLCDETS